MIINFQTEKLENIHIFFYEFSRVPLWENPFQKQCHFEFACFQRELKIVFFEV